MITSTAFKLTDTAVPRAAATGRREMAATTSPYVPEADIYEKLADGRVVLVAARGVPIPMVRARQLGLVKDSAPAGPTHVKAAEMPVEEPVADATEAAAELAAARGIDLATVRGTGAGGRIIKSDVEALLED